MESTAGEVVAVHCKSAHKSLPVLKKMGSAFLLCHRGRRNNVQKKWSSHQDTRRRRENRKRGGQLSDSGLIEKRNRTVDEVVDPAVRGVAPACIHLLNVWAEVALGKSHRIE